MEKTAYQELYVWYFSSNVTGGVKVKDNKKGGACGTYGGKERCIQDFGREKLRKNYTWKTQT